MAYRTLYCRHKCLLKFFSRASVVSYENAECFYSKSISLYETCKKSLISIIQKKFAIYKVPDKEQLLLINMFGLIKLKKIKIQQVNRGIFVINYIFNPKKNHEVFFPFSFNCPLTAVRHNQIVHPYSLSYLVFCPLLYCCTHRFCSTRNTSKFLTL